MATLKQRKALERLVENRGNVSRSMIEAGYSPATAKNPKNLTESPGFRELLEEYGLTESLVAKALVEDIEKKPQNRVSELSLAADILGMKKGGWGGTTNILIVRPSENEMRQVEKALEDMFTDNTMHTNGENQEHS
jgi:hypothetical protein